MWTGRYVERNSPLSPIEVILLLATGFLVVGAGLGGAGGPSAGPSASAPGVGIVHSPTEYSSLAPGAPPAAAFTLTVAGFSPGAISLSWTDPGSFLFAQYAVDESASSATGPWSTVGIVTTSATATEFATTGLSPGGTYWWEVVETYGLASNTESTNVVEQTQPGVAFLNSSGVTSSTATLSWTDNASYGGWLNFSSYQVYEAVNGSNPGVVNTFTVESTRGETVTGLAPGTGYNFFVVTNACTAACSTGGATLSSTQSNAVSLGTTFPLTASLTAQRTTVDVGQFAYFTCTPSGGQAPYRFAWDFGNGTFLPGNNSASTSFSTPGTPTIGCQVTDNESSVAEAPRGIVVNPAPVLTAVTNRTSADVGEAVAFTCTVANGTPPVTVGWNFGDGNSANGGNATHAYSSAGPEIASCSGVDGAGVSVAGSVSLEISPTLQTSASANSAQAGPGENLTFTAYPENGSGTYRSVEWRFSDGGTAAGTSVTHAFEAAGSASATVTVTDSNGGMATALVPITVEQLTASLLGPDAATTGQSLTFSAAAAGGAGGPYNYTWNFGDGGVAYGPSVQHAYGSTGAFTPTLVVTDHLGGALHVALASVAVSNAPLPLQSVFPWVLLLIAIGIGALVGATVYARRRKSERDDSRRMGGWVPPTPSHTGAGARVCRYCQHSNVPLRRTCSACGKPLPRAPAR